MARQKKLAAAAINIRIHPHTPVLYRALMQEAFALRRAIRVRGDAHMIMSYLDTSQTDETGKVRGAIARFTNIETDMPWFDFGTMQKADENQLKSIRIPENLRPNMISSSFIFDVKTHTLVYEHYFDGRTITARQMLKFFNALFADVRILERYGEVDVSILSDRERLEQIVAITHLRL